MNGELNFEAMSFKGYDRLPALASEQTGFESRKNTVDGERDHAPRGSRRTLNRSVPPSGRRRQSPGRRS